MIVYIEQSNRPLHSFNNCPKCERLTSIVKKVVDVMAYTLNSNIWIKSQFIAVDNIIFDSFVFQHEGVSETLWVNL